MNQTERESCLFCAIIRGEISARIVVETDRLVAFHDINPKAAVHVLVVPRDHHRDVVELAAADSAALADLVATANDVARQFTEDGHFRLVFNTGTGAGQSVPHVHAHVMAGPTMADL